MRFVEKAIRTQQRYFCEMRRASIKNLMSFGFYKNSIKKVLKN